MNGTFYKKSVVNNYLGIKEEIKGSYPAEVKVKAETRLARWEGREKRQRDREEIDSLRELSRYDTNQAERFIEECKNILEKNLKADKAIEWVSLYDDRPFPPFVFKEPAPKYKLIVKEKKIPEKNFLKELLFPSIRSMRLRLEKEAQLTFQEKLRRYSERKESARSVHEKQREEYFEEQKEYNSSVDELQMDFAKGRPEAVESLVRIALARLFYPDSIKVDFDAQYEPNEKLVILDAVFPLPYEIPRTIRYIYNEEEHGITAVEMAQNEFLNFYESIVLQITLSSIDLIFKSINTRYIEQIGFNGWLKDEPEGETKHCVLTCKVSRELFNTLDLAGTLPKKCFANLQGLMAEPLWGLTQVQPMTRLIRTPSLYSDTGRIIAEDAATEKDAYQPGDIKQAARELLEEIFSQIEKDLLYFSQTKKNDLN